eukprot:4972594-Prymnesium_polylepis.1
MRVDGRAGGDTRGQPPGRDDPRAASQRVKKLERPARRRAAHADRGVVRRAVGPYFAAEERRAVGAHAPAQGACGGVHAGVGQDDQRRVDVRVGWLHRIGRRQQERGGHPQ